MDLITRLSYCTAVQWSVNLEFFHHEIQGKANRLVSGAEEGQDANPCGELLW